MLDTKTIAIIGAGAMGSAFYKGFSAIVPQEKLIVHDRNEHKLQALGASRISLNADEVVEEADIVLLAVKPQSFSMFNSALNSPLKDKLVISIMAGISLHTLYQYTESNRIVRSMPNLAVEVHQSIIGWVASGEISSSDKVFISSLFQSVGTDMEFLEEEMIDRIAPLSGSGPAFFFYLTELLENKAQELGFSAAQAKSIAEHTFVGAANYFATSGMDAEAARKAVTSKGGITETALKHMNEKQFPEIFSEALTKAIERSADLNK